MLRLQRKIVANLNLKCRVVKKAMTTIILKTAKATINHVMMIVARLV